jgi:hypothetical protein
MNTTPLEMAVAGLRELAAEEHSLFRPEDAAYRFLKLCGEIWDELPNDQQNKFSPPAIYMILITCRFADDRLLNTSFSNFALITVLALFADRPNCIPSEYLYAPHFLERSKHQSTADRLSASKEPQILTFHQENYNVSGAFLLSHYGGLVKKLDHNVAHVPDDLVSAISLDVTTACHRVIAAVESLHVPLDVGAPIDQGATKSLS